MGVILTGKQAAILAGELQPKFLASVSRAGEPNVVPVLSLCPCGPGLAGFAEFMIWKSKTNLKETGRAALLALDPKLNFLAAHGAFGGFVTSGPIFDAMANQAMFRYNPYNGIRGAGTIDLEAVDAEGRIPMLAMLATHLRAGRLSRAAGAEAATRAAARATGGVGQAGTPATMPPQVTDKFARLKALKAVAWPVAAGSDKAGMGAPDGRRGEGPGGFDVRVLPAAGVAPVGRSALVVADKTITQAIPEGSRVAVAVITLEPVAYQVKGIAHHWRGALLIDVTEAYTAGPPVPGRLCSPAAG